MDFTRIFRHIMTGPIAVRRTFPEAALKAIEQAIRYSEMTHAGEVCFAVEPSLDTLPLLNGQTARERAIEVFSQLRVWDTEQNNGVLIYLLLADHDVEIVADRGINVRVGHEKWEAICRLMEESFREGKFESGVVAGIHAVGNHLEEYFPVRPGGQNELPDRPVIL